MLFRSVPGLRREELSQLANVSIDYVVRLEQGRTRRVSRPVLDALADALQLTPDERAYLATLAEVASALHPRRPAKPEITPQLQQLLDDMHGIPAMVVYRRMHVLAWNRGAAALLTDFGAMPPPDRNLVRLMFLDHAFRSLYADWPRAARDCVAVLRMEAGQHPDDPAVTPSNRARRHGAVRQHRTPTTVTCPVAARQPIREPAEARPIQITG